jgi:hypothetical protein
VSQYTPSLKRYHRGVKRAFASVAGLIGLAALGRWLARRRQPATTPAEPVEATTAADSQAADPAEELRRKLADARVPEPDGATAAEPPAETLDERRARVHAKAREAIDSMNGPAGDDGMAS